MNLRAITVCVDYGDLLGITVPYNRHHFDEWMIVTTPQDEVTKRVAKQNDCGIYMTEAFYEQGADFNKFLALEDGLDVMGRYGWLCLIDADTVWPKSVPDFGVMKGCLYTPRRYMFTNVTKPIPPETKWGACQMHPNGAEWAGYTQIFHAEDEHLGDPPWHGIHWRHAGTGDSVFQGKWPKANKIRPPFMVLHLGVPGQNWCGRATVRTDGTVPEGASQKIEKVAKYKSGRRENPREDPFRHERF